MDLKTFTEITLAQNSRLEGLIDECTFDGSPLYAVKAETNTVGSKPILFTKLKPIELSRNPVDARCQLQQLRKELGPEETERLIDEEMALSAGTATDR